jgi:alkanesulfonate monooxygenase SsuD/methylene tetrahydromethanopterin reductase-like flavin-dependent oxidoreductase (luciferase family)
MAASIDELSGGRFIFGIGAGWNEAEFRAFGIPFDRLASRFEESFEVVRRLLAGEVVTFSGEFHRVEGAVLLPPPARRVPLMVGSNGARMLAATLPHVEAWNTWYSSYGNTVEGFAARNAEIDAACARVGRDPSAVRRSACILVTVGGGGERPHDTAPVPVELLAAHLTELGAAGLNEAILVVDPITERSVREIAERVR